MAKVTLIDSKKRLYVIRHGTTSLDPMKRSDGFIDLPLSEAGQQGTVEVINKLKRADIACIYSGTLKRHKETAHILKSGFPTCKEITHDERANTWNLGLNAGNPKKPNKPIVEHLMANPTLVPEGGDSYRKFGDRLWSFMKERFAEARRGEGPQAIVLSGSGCRYISDRLLGNKEILDIDEDGCFVLYPTGKTAFGAQVLWGHKSAEDENFS